MAIQKRSRARIVKEIVPQEIVDAFDLHQLNRIVIDAYHNAGYFGGGFEQERNTYFYYSNNKFLLHTPKYTRYMLYGRRPGKMPPVSAIEGWCKKYNIQISPWAIAKKIARDGTEGNDFLGQPRVMIKLIDNVDKQLMNIINKQIINNAYN